MIMLHSGQQEVLALVFSITFSTLLSNMEGDRQHIASSASSCSFMSCLSRQYAERLITIFFVGLREDVWRKDLPTITDYA